MHRAVWRLKLPFPMIVENDFQGFICCILLGWGLGFKHARDILHLRWWTGTTWVLANVFVRGSLLDLYSWRGCTLTKDGNVSWSNSLRRNQSKLLSKFGVFFHCAANNVDSSRILFGSKVYFCHQWTSLIQVYIIRLMLSWLRVWLSNSSLIYNIGDVSMLSNIGCCHMSRVGSYEFYTGFIS